MKHVHCDFLTIGTDYGTHVEYRRIASAIVLLLRGEREPLFVSEERILRQVSEQFH